ncbi:MULTISPECIES: CD1375 family protein [Paenibacillus]|nr:MULTISPECIES: CD1375 family protein [Paenibacillus]
MVKVYFDLIQKDLKTIDDVPLRWKSGVQELLASAA